MQRVFLCLTLLFASIVSALDCTAQTMTQTITLCVDQSPIPPFSFPDREGQAQRLIRMAIEKQGWRMQARVEPVNRCRANLKLGLLDASATLVPTAANREAGIFPMRGDVLDTAKALGVGRGFVYRLVGSNADWDGQKFSNVALPVLYQLGVTVAQAKLSALKVAHRDSGKTVPQLFRMLILKRADVVLGREFEADAVLQSSEFRGKIEKIAVPFITSEFYLVFSRSFYMRESATAERIWSTIAEIKAENKAEGH